MKSITNISEYIDKLSVKDRDLFHRIYSIISGYGSLKLPKEMHKWVNSTFGSVKNVEKQYIIRIDNHVTFDTTLYNELRTMRPMESKVDDDLQKIIKEKKGGNFCKPEIGTPADSFGRIKGKKSISASNLAKYDAVHGVVVFKEHNPLKFTASDIKDYLETADKWIKTAYKKNSQRKYPYILWNCLWKSGASIVHGHMQMIVGKTRHYGEIEKLRIFSEEYKQVFKSNYFKDLFNIHKFLGLGFKSKDVEVIAHLTARKEKEIMIISDKLNNVSEAVYKVLKAYLNMGVESFNLGVYLSPLDKSWKMPVIIRLVDRGSLQNKSTDIGGTEIFGVGNVVSSDPFKIIDKVKKEF